MSVVAINSEHIDFKLFMVQNLINLVNFNLFMVQKLVKLQTDALIHYRNNLKNKYCIHRNRLKLKRFNIKFTYLLPNASIHILDLSNILMRLQPSVPIPDTLSKLANYLFDTFQLHLWRLPLCDIFHTFQIMTTNLPVVKKDCQNFTIAMSHRAESSSQILQSDVSKLF